jgi:hypothetical protein
MLLPAQVTGRGASSAAFRVLLRRAVFLIAWPSVIFHPRITCVLFHEPTVEFWLGVLLRMSLASAFPPIVT